jgi:SAM-dependent methyltransferase
MKKAGAAATASKAETNTAVLKQAALRRLPRRVSGSGQVVFPAVPALLDHAVGVLNTTFTALGRAFSAAELEHVRELVGEKMRSGFEQSPYAKVIIDYETDPLPKTSLSYKVSLLIRTMSDEYDTWVQERQPPLFGSHPDAKLMQLAQSLGTPAETPVLDIGAGTGRNTLPLAKAGFPADAVEMSSSLAAILKADAAKQNLTLRIFEGDALDPALELPQSHYKLCILAEVFSHFRELGQARRLFERAAEFLAPGGLLLFSAFLSRDGYKPDALARELSEVFWCTAFTRAELAEAAEGLPFDRISDESVCDFEHAHLPPEAWPPTGWFEEWTRGQDLYVLPPEKSPLELRWVVYRRR